MNIQIMGTKKDRTTQKTQRWFKERNIDFHFRDLSEKGMSPRELEAVIRVYPLSRAIDEDSKAFNARQLAWKDYDAAEEILEDSTLIRMPVVRNGAKLTLGYEPEQWQSWKDEE